MTATFKYRLVKASWAVALDITADSTFPLAIPDGAVMTKDRLWLAIIPEWLSREERRYLQFGLTLVADLILECKPDVEYVLVRLLDVHFNPCHYQVEGFAAAIAGWAAHEFGFNGVEIPIGLDRARKRYIYGFPDGQEAMIAPSMLRILTPARSSPLIWRPRQNWKMSRAEPPPAAVAQSDSSGGNPAPIQNRGSKALQIA